MSNNLDKFDTNIKDILESYRPEYSSSSWGKLKKELPQKSNALYYVAASVLLVAGLVTSLYLINKTDYKKEFAKNGNTEINNQIVNEVKSSNKRIVSQVNRADSEIVKEKENEQAQRIIKQKLTETINQENSKIKSGVNKDSNYERNTVEVENNTPVLENIIPNNNVVKQTEISPELILSTKGGCEPLEIDFNIKNLPLDSKVQWNLTDGYSSNAKTFQHTLQKDGAFKVKLTVSTATNQYVLEEEIIVKQTPRASFKLSEVEGLITLENNSQDYESLKWNFPGIITDEENPSFEMLYSDNYKIELTAINTNGCTDKKIQTLDYKVNHHIFAPNAFTPDGDGINDEFIVKYEAKEGYQYLLQIFNSTGKELFETKDKNIGWNGKGAVSNSSLNHEKFLWRLIIKDPRGNREVKEGYFEKLGI